MKNLNLILLLFVTVSLFSCAKTNEDTARLLIGRWQLREALRNDRPTESLAEMYMEFTADGKLRTNVAGTPEEGTYELKGEQVLQRNISMSADYKIESIEDANLVLTTTLRGYAFRFSFTRANASTTETSEVTSQ